MQPLDTLRGSHLSTGPRVVTITDNFLRGGLESRVEICSTRFGAHLVLAERSCPSSRAEPAEISSFRPAGLIAKARSLANRIEAFEADSVDVHPFHAGLTGLLAACLAGRPALLTLHGPASLSLPFAPWQWQAFDHLMGTARPRLIAVSPEIRAAALRQWPDFACEVLPNGVLRTGGWQPVYSDRLVMATRLDADKLSGVLDLVRLVGRVPHLRLELFGDGDSIRRVRAEIQRLGLGNRVRLRGHVSEPAGAFPVGATVAGCGRALLEGLIQGRRGLVVSADQVIRPASRADMPKLARANYSGRGMIAWPHAAVLRWLRRGANPCDHVADLVPTDMAERFGHIARCEIARTDPARLRKIGLEVVALLSKL